MINSILIIKKNTTFLVIYSITITKFIDGEIYINDLIAEEKIKNNNGF